MDEENMDIRATGDSTDAVRQRLDWLFWNCMTSRHNQNMASWHSILESISIEISPKILPGERKLTLEYSEKLVPLLNAYYRGVELTKKKEYTVPINPELITLLKSLEMHLRKIANRLGLLITTREETIYFRFRR